MILHSSHIEEFQSLVLQYGKDNYREMPWRQVHNPYYVLVSEIMLQQTQVQRVEVKFIEFISYFPTMESLAQADFFEVLQLWSGLGYNRRAKYLHDAAQAIVALDKFPATCEELQIYKGIGKNTAAAIIVYAFNQPLVFVETNVRTVIFHHFYDDFLHKISDSEVENIVEQTLYTQNPREWYWALMDYGVHLKKQVGNLNVKSKSYTKQSAFEGSHRQKRAKALRFLLHTGPQDISSIAQHLSVLESEARIITQELECEQLIRQHNNLYTIA